MINKNVILILLAGMILIAGCSTAGETTSKKAPDFSLQDINGKTVRLSDYSGKVIILNFFATWCPPCREEIPDFIELVNTTDKERFVIIGISVEKGDEGTVRKFAAAKKINYPVLVDDGLVSKTYGPISSIPTTFIIDRNGNITEKIIGSRTKTEFEGRIKPLL
ncbi:MAG: TlpA disulfide reductase family protein [Candidatus Omnitrophota bacterium]|nr:TlpA disulfide reductase family protein [Candidatus Omnitrophota bacterium]